MLEKLRGLGKFSKIRNISDSDIPPAEAPRTLSSDKYFFFAAFASLRRRWTCFAGDNRKFGCGSPALCASWCHSCSLCASIGFVVRHSRGNGHSVFLSLDCRFRGSDERFRPKCRLRQFVPPLSQHPLAQFFTGPRHRRKRIQPLIGPRGVDYGARIKTLLITGNNGIERTAPATAKNFDIFHGIGPCT